MKYQCFSFPGGKASAEDGSLVQTALRETWEEIGLTPRRVEVWSQMAAAPFPVRIAHSRCRLAFVLR